MSKVVFISGSISGDPNYEEHFADMEQRLKDLGLVPINPIEPLGLYYRQYIDIGLAKLKYCDAVVMLDTWLNSQGARLEKMYAETVGIPVYYEFNVEDIVNE